MSATEKPAINKLSSAVMELKFMKRSKEKFEKQEEDEERRHLYKEQLATLHNSSNCIVLMPSFYDIKTYLPCRLSFGGAEPEIEKLNITKLSGLYKVETPPEIDQSLMKTDVSEDQMAENYAENKLKRKSAHEYDGKNKRKSNDNFQKPSNSPRFQGLKKDYQNFFQKAETDEFEVTHQASSDGCEKLEEGEYEEDVKSPNINENDFNAVSKTNKKFNKFQNKNSPKNAGDFRNKNFDSSKGRFEKNFNGPKGNFQNRNLNSPNSVENKKFPKPDGKFSKKRKSDRYFKESDNRLDLEQHDFDVRPRKSPKTDFVDKPRKSPKTDFVDKPRKSPKTDFVDKPRKSPKTDFVDKPRKSPKPDFVDKPRKSPKTDFVDKPRKNPKTDFDDKPSKSPKMPKEENILEDNNVDGDVAVIKTVKKKKKGKKVKVPALAADRFFAPEVKGFFKQKGVMKVMLPKQKKKFQKPKQDD